MFEDEVIYSFKGERYKVWVRKGDVENEQVGSCVREMNTLKPKERRKTMETETGDEKRNEAVLGKSKR